ncbi:MAG: MmgE/PrpD family protein [Anderseniella sp.]
MPKTALHRLAENLLARQSDDKALQLARHSVLDTAGCILAGSDSVQVMRLQAALESAGSGSVASALRNGTAAHALDFDDYEELGSTHPSAVLVPALLALAGEQKYTNAQVLNAYVSGYETILAAGRLLGYQHYLAGWHATSTIGRIGAAMACSRLLQLDSDQAVNALSLAMTQCAGMKVEFGTDAKPLHAGLAARTGVEAALLAQAGFTGAANAGEGEAGFFQLYGTPASPGWDCLLEASLPRINDYPPFLKPSPSCGYTLRAIEAAELLHARQEYSHLAINKVTVDIAEPYFAVAGIDRPREPCEARFSLVYCVASALIDGKVDIASFTPEMLHRSQISEVSAKTSVRTYALAAGLGDMSPQAPDTVTVHMKDGTQLAETVARVRGGPGRLLCGDDVVAKYVSCGGRTKMALEFLQADPCDLFTGRISR